MFNEFIEKKESEKFNDDVIKATRGYCQLTQIGLDEDNQIFKVIINPDAKKTICFVTGDGRGKGGPYGVLEFLKNRIYIPERKKVVILPLTNPVSFNESSRNEDDLLQALQDDKLVILCVIKEDSDALALALNHMHLKELANDLKDLAQRYFSVSVDKPSPNSLEKKIYEDKAVPYLIIDLPGKAPLQKRTEFTKNAIKLVINSI